jgi:PKD repeat protein
MRMNTASGLTGIVFVAGLVLASGVAWGGSPTLVPSTHGVGGSHLESSVSFPGVSSDRLPRVALEPSLLSPGPTSTDCGPGLPEPARCAVPTAGGLATNMTLPTWNNATPNLPSPVPGSAVGASAAFDPSLGGVVYFGGCARVSCPNNQTWLFSNGSWRNLTGNVAPAPRANASLVYDHSANELVLFGGLGLGNRQLQDTWTFSQDAWKPYVATPAHPPARWLAALTAYNNSTSDAVLLFGGCGGYPCGGLLADTWVWTASGGWIQVHPPTSPSPRGGAMLAMDSAAGYAVLVGGGTFSTPGGWTCASGFWTYQSGAWTLHSSGAPPGRGLGVLTYDQTDQRLVLFGGINGTQAYGDTWIFDNGSWTMPSLVSSPAPRAGAAGPGYSPVPIVVGGACGVGCGPGVDTWVFEVPPKGIVTVSPAITDVGLPIAFNELSQGGFPPYRQLWSLGDGVSANQTLVAHAYKANGTYNVQVGVLDSLGVETTTETTALIHSLPALGLVSGPQAGDLGHSASWLVRSTQNGTLPDRVAWNFGDGGNTTGWTSSHVFGATGSYDIVATVTDSAGGSSSLSLPFDVHPALSMSISTVPAKPLAGQAVVFFAGTSGGTDPITVAWAFGDNTTSALTTPSHVYGSPGNRTVTATITDAAGAQVVSSVELTVATTPTPSSVSTIPWTLVGLAISVGAILLAGPALVLYFRVRAKQKAMGDGEEAWRDGPRMSARRRLRELLK